MNNLTDIAYIKSILKRHGFTFSKALGQNFLINPTVCPRMAEYCGASDTCGVIEIGPGAGVLTRELSKTAHKVVAIELDKRLLPVLRETLAECDNVKIINGDALRIDFNKLIEDEFAYGDVVICANLPYYITSPVIMRILEERLPIKSLTVMVQLEAAKRICAEPGTREAGAVSVAVRYYAVPEMLFKVSAGSFVPPPKVDSEVIKLNILNNPAVAPKDEKLFFKIVRSAFAQRRKTLSNSLSSGLSLSKGEVASALEYCGIKLTARAEELSMDEFVMLADFLTD